MVFNRSFICYTTLLYRPECAGRGLSGDHQQMADGLPESLESSVGLV
jgi:hypothetical protein